jgi:hypothetical protein
MNSGIALENIACWFAFKPEIGPPAPGGPVRTPGSRAVCAIPANGTNSTAAERIVIRLSLAQAQSVFEQGDTFAFWDIDSPWD